MAIRTAFTTPLYILRATSRASVSARTQARASSSSSRTLMTAPSPQATKPTPPPTPTKRPKLTLLYDGECPLCMKEVNFLKSRSELHNDSLGFVDIASKSYDPSANASIPYDVAMGRIHAIDEAGNVIAGVKVFRDAYEAVGLGWVYALTKLPGVSWLAEKVYDVWADRRLQFTGRPSLVDILRERERTCR